MVKVKSENFVKMMQKLLAAALARLYCVEVGCIVLEFCKNGQLGVMHTHIFRLGRMQMLIVTCS